MKTNHWYHAFSGIVFVIIGIYFLSAPPENLKGASGTGIQRFLPWVIITWGIFKGINSFLIYKKKKND